MTLTPRAKYPDPRSWRHASLRVAAVVILLAAGPAGAVPVSMGHGYHLYSSSADASFFTGSAMGSAAVVNQSGGWVDGQYLGDGGASTSAEVAGGRFGGSAIGLVTMSWLFDVTAAQFGYTYLDHSIDMFIAGSALFGRAVSGAELRVWNWAWGGALGIPYWIRSPSPELDLVFTGTTIHTGTDRIGFYFPPWNNTVPIRQEVVFKVFSEVNAWPLIDVALTTNLAFVDFTVRLDDGTQPPPPLPVPEPSTLLLLGFGVAGVAGLGLRRARRGGS